MEEDPKEIIQSMIQRIVTTLVRNDDRVLTKYRTDDLGVRYTVSVADEDARFLVGRQGMNVQAIRHLVRAAGKRFSLAASVGFDIPQRDGKGREDTSDNTQKEQ